MTKRCLLIVALIVAVCSWAFGPSALAQQRPAGAWITAWGTSQQALGMTGVTNASVRMIARVTISGDAVRFRLANTFGTTPLTIGKAYVGQRTQGAALVAGSNRPV